MNGWYAAVKVLKNALCFIMGYLVAMEIRVTLFLLVQFCICLYKIDEVRKYAKIAFYLTSRDAKTLRHASWGLRHFWLVFWQGTFWNQPEVSTTSGSKVMAQIVVFVFSLTLTFDLCSIVCHTHCAWCTGISMRSFIRIRPVILGDMPWTHTHTHIHTHRWSF